MTHHSTYKPDWTFLVRALQRGGEVTVDSPSARASLLAAGLMVDAPAVRPGRFQKGTPMALTKAGARRATEIQAQTGSTSYFKHVRKLRNVAVNKNAPARRRATRMAPLYER